MATAPITPSTTSPMAASELLTEGSERGATFHVKQSGLDYLSGELGTLRAAGLLRERVAPMEASVRTFCSNDYLGLSGRLAVEGHAGGAGASRLVLGDRPEHHDLEDGFARYLGRDAALLFPSGYAANVGLLSALAGRGDLVISDALNHASIVDGARLSRATVRIVPHLDFAAVEVALRDRAAFRRAFIVTESYFSMDADSPDLGRLTAISRDFDAALLVDEAHALGVLGPGGRGLCAQPFVGADAVVGTLGKSFGASGALVAGSASLRAWLWNRARSFVFTTGVSPALAAHATANLAEVERADDLRAAVLQSASQLRDGMRALGLSPAGYGPIVPWVVGAPDVALAVAAKLRLEGILVQAIRPPTVPVGTARLRFTVTARHTTEDVGGLLSAIARVLPCLPR